MWGTGVNVVVGVSVTGGVSKPQASVKATRMAMAKVDFLMA